MVGRQERIVGHTRTYRPTDGGIRILGVQAWFIARRRRLNLAIEGSIGADLLFLLHCGEGFDLCNRFE